MNTSGKSNGFNGSRQLNGFYTNRPGMYGLRGIGVIDPVTLTTVSTIVKLAPKLAALAKKVGSLINKIGIGGVDDERFFISYTALRNILINAGYLVMGSDFHEKALDKFKIRRTQVRDKADNYTPEFKRLRDWVIYIMNNANPGLGDDYSQLFPSFKMANQGQIYTDNIDVVKAIVDAIPKGKYVKGMLQEALKGTDTTNAGTSATQDVKPNDALYQSVVNGYTVITDAAGKVQQIRDAAGKLLNPGTPEYNAAAAGVPKAKEAGMGTVVGIAAVLLFGGLAVAASRGDKKKEVKS